MYYNKEKSINDSCYLETSLSLRHLKKVHHVAASYDAL